MRSKQLILEIASVGLLSVCSQAQGAEEPSSSGGGVDALLMRPSASVHGMLGLESAALLEQESANLGVTLEHADQLLQVSVDGATPEDILGSLDVLHLRSAYGVRPWLELGGSLPLVLRRNALNPETGEALFTQAPGDLMLYGRVGLLAEQGRTPGVTMLLPLTVPNGDEKGWLGEGGVTFSPRMILGVHQQRLGWMASLGYRVRPATALVYQPLSVEIPLGNELLYAAGVNFELMPGLKLGAGLDGRLGATDSKLSYPLEGRLGGQLGLPNGLIFELAASTGLTSGYAVPAWRIFGGLTWAPTTRGFWRKDADLDGLLDDNDKCPQVAEDADGWLDGDGCPDPDNDNDAILDGADKCPNEPETINTAQDDDGCPEADRDVDGLVDDNDRCPERAEDRDGFQDEDGCPDPDNDEDTVEDTQDTCPSAAEDRDGFQDEDGCPEPDNDGDMVQDLVDACPNEAENRNGYLDEDGCPDEPPPTPKAEDAKAEAEQGGDKAEKTPGTSEKSAPADTSASKADAEADPLADPLGDLDKDGVVNGKDKCPRKPETVNGFKDTDGCPETDTDQDGLPDAIDKCPKVAENLNRVQDLDGCPEADGDQDGLVDPVDKCPKKPETVNGFKDTDGCPDVAPEATPEKAEKAAEKPTAEPAKSPKTEPNASSADTTQGKDSDGDGIPDKQDACPQLEEVYNGYQDNDGCPEKDTDGDGIVDPLDKCPKKPEWVNGFKDDDGCPEWDTDGDGFFDALDQCPKKPETVNGIEDTDGCPEVDSDFDGILDIHDKCKAARETANGFEDEDGCPDVAPKGTRSPQAAPAEKAMPSPEHSPAPSEEKAAPPADKASAEGQEGEKSAPAPAQAEPAAPTAPEHTGGQPH
ncbi:MAG: thrombospondin type 3 repeat-containing protein [Myxococcota bacterium]